MIRPRRAVDGSGMPSMGTQNRWRPSSLLSSRPKLFASERCLPRCPGLRLLVGFILSCVALYEIVGFLPPLKAPHAVSSYDVVPSDNTVLPDLASSLQIAVDNKLPVEERQDDDDDDTNNGGGLTIEIDEDGDDHEQQQLQNDEENIILQLPPDGDDHAVDTALIVDSEAENQPEPLTITSSSDTTTTTTTTNNDQQQQSQEPPLSPEPVDGIVGGDQYGGTYDGTSMHLFKQIELPSKPILQHYDSGQNYWPLHNILKNRGWGIATSAPPGRVTLWISKGAVPSRLKRGQQMLNSMGVSGCIGGAKTLQLSCRRRLAQLHGCDYDTLGVQPPQYNMLDVEDCHRFFADADKPELQDKLYLSKPSYTFHGAGIRVMRVKELKAEYTCKAPKHAIVMEYVSKPATMNGGYKFDFRTYLLVASLNPQLVFYHDGFVRKSDKVYDVNAKDLNVHITNKISQSKEEHFYNFSYLGESLHKEMRFPKDHVDTYIRPRAQAVSRFVFHTARVQAQPPNHVPGRFHLFGMDWILDSTGKMHLLEGNGYPLVTDAEKREEDPKIWEEMMDLILAIQTNPQSLGDKVTVKDKFKFGGWVLVFNELEELMVASQGHKYDGCQME